MMAPVRLALLAAAVLVTLGAASAQNPIGHEGNSAWGRGDKLSSV